MKFPFSLSHEREFACTGFGLNAVDHLMVVPAYPNFDTKTRLREHVQTAGGQTATAMVGLQRLGFRTAYAGRFGSDAEGRFGLKTLEDEGVDVKFAEIIDGARTQLAFIIIDERTGERTIIWDRDERLAYKKDEAPVDLVARGRVLHLDAHDPPACAKMAHAARTSGTIVSTDIDNIYEGLPELLPLINILISSKEFPHRLTGIVDEHASMIEIHARYGCDIVGMTCGTRGAFFYHDGAFLESKAFAVPGGCRDTTGAGDAFRAGFLYGLLSGEDIETTIKLANATAALKCRNLGARTSLPKQDELSEFMKNAIPLV